MRVVTNDNEHYENLQKRKLYLAEIERSMDGDFGITLLAALEQLEGSAYSTLYKSSMKSRVAQAKAEIKTVQYIKGTLMAFRSEKATVDSMVKQIDEGDEYGEV